MDNFDKLDLWEWELDNRLNNPVYPPFLPTSDFNPASLFTAPDGHIYTPEEMSAILDQYSCPIPNGEMTNPQEIPQPIGPCQVSYDQQPDGTVIVTDVAGCKHLYMSMEQANACTDFISGMPRDAFSSMPSPSSAEYSKGGDYNPRDDYSAMPFCDSKHDQIVYEEQKHIQEDAVNKYKEALAKGDVEEAGKWEKVAIDAEYSKQAHTKFYPTYGLDARTLAGLDD